MASSQAGLLQEPELPETEARRTRPTEPGTSGPTLIEKSRSGAPATPSGAVSARTRHAGETAGAGARSTMPSTGAPWHPIHAAMHVVRPLADAERPQQRGRRAQPPGTERHRVAGARGGPGPADTRVDTATGGVAHATTRQGTSPAVSICPRTVTGSINLRRPASELTHPRGQAVDFSSAVPLRDGGRIARSQRARCARSTSWTQAPDRWHARCRRNKASPVDPDPAKGATGRDRQAPDHAGRSPTYPCTRPDRRTSTVSRSGALPAAIEVLLALPTPGPGPHACAGSGRPALVCSAAPATYLTRLSTA